MNHWQMENLSKLRREDVRREIYEIRAGEKFTNETTRSARLLDRYARILAGWMVRTGQRLQERYDAPMDPNRHVYSR